MSGEYCYVLHPFFSEGEKCAALFFDPDDDPEEGVYSPAPKGEE